MVLPFWLLPSAISNLFPALSPRILFSTNGCLFRESARLSRHLLQLSGVYMAPALLSLHTRLILGLGDGAVPDNDTSFWEEWNSSCPSRFGLLSIWLLSQKIQEPNKDARLQDKGMPSHQPVGALSHSKQTVLNVNTWPPGNRPQASTLGKWQKLILFSKLLLFFISCCDIMADFTFLAKLEHSTGFLSSSLATHV